MRKIAVFVEGQAELVFVREFLKIWYEYSIDIECRRLLADDNLGDVPYSFSNSTAPIHVQIIDTGGDNKVLSRILRREQSLINAGYEVIVGLRDMYSEDYKNIVKTRTVDLLVNDQFRQGTNQAILQKAKRPDGIRICFAVMEVEAWWLGMPSLWTSLDATVLQTYRACFETPEMTFHPASLVGKLRQSKGETYSKRNDEVESIVGQLKQEHYVDLHQSQRCPSFCEFVHYIQS